MNHTCIYSQPQSITALWLVLVSRPADGRRLSWPGWLGEIPRWFAGLKTVTHSGILAAASGNRPHDHRPVQFPDHASSGSKHRAVSVGWVEPEHDGFRGEVHSPENRGLWRSPQKLSSDVPMTQFTRIFGASWVVDGVVRSPENFE